MYNFGHLYHLPDSHIIGGPVWIGGIIPNWEDWEVGDEIFPPLNSI
jgi:hypothetical protein